MDEEQMPSELAPYPLFQLGWIKHHPEKSQ